MKHSRFINKYLSLSRKINLKRCHCSVYKRIHERHEANTLDWSIYNYFIAWLKIIRKSFVILSLDPVGNTSLLQCFPVKGYGSNSRSCAVLHTCSLQRPPLLKNRLGSIRWFHIWAKNIPWLWLAGWKTPAVFRRYKENLDASRW